MPNTSQDRTRLSLTLFRGTFYPGVAFVVQQRQNMELIPRSVHRPLHLGQESVVEG
jgi:hypothetical protein